MDGWKDGGTDLEGQTHKTDSNIPLQMGNNDYSLITIDAEMRGVVGSTNLIDTECCDAILIFVYDLTWVIYRWSTPI